MNMKNEISWWAYPIRSIFVGIDKRMWRLWVVWTIAAIIYAPILQSVHGTPTLEIFAVWWLACLGIASVIIKRYLL